MRYYPLDMDSEAKVSGLAKKKEKFSWVLPAFGIDDAALEWREFLLVNARADSLQLDQLNDMNENVLYTLAQVATTLAGFSGLVVVFRARDAVNW